MSYRDQIRDLRARIHRIEAELLPVHAGVDSHEAAALIGAARDQLRAADRILGRTLAEQLDQPIHPRAAGELATAGAAR